MYGPTSNTAGAVDAVFHFFLVVSLVLLVLVMTLMITFAVRYRQSKHPQAVQIGGSVLLEIIWTGIPVAIVMVMFYVGTEGFKILRDVPPDAMHVEVIGRMWDWTFRYDNGKETKKLYVPVDRPIRLTLKSLDVNHSFFVPAFRVKEDLVPGKENYLWFKPQTTGPADIFCAEYCGQRHAYMMSEVDVMEQPQFDAWFASAAAEPGQERGVPGLLAEKGCLDCHTLNGNQDVGPTFLGLYGRQRVVLRDGSERDVIADETYLRRAIREPDAEYVRDFETNMPVVGLSDEEVTAIIEYLKTLAGDEAATRDAAAGEAAAGEAPTRGGASPGAAAGTR
jgi:cytochrome c oxidase subunit 2